MRRWGDKLLRAKHTRLMTLVMAGALTIVAGCSTTSRGVATVSTPGPGTNSSSESSAATTTAPTSTDGSSSPVSTSDSAGTGNDPAATFDYPSTPATLPPTVGTENAGRIAEGARLAEYVVVPSFVLPDYTESAGLSTYIIKDGPSTGNVLPAGAPEIATEFNMITGFSTARSTLDDSVGRNRNLILAVLIFGSADDAKSAAEAMNGVIGAVKDGPETVAVPGIEGDIVAAAVSGMNSGRAQVFVARGQLVHYVWTSTKGDAVEAMAQVIATVLKAQFPISDTFVPTPSDRLSRLPTDRDGMLAHTLLSPDKIVNANKVYGINGFKHFFANPLLDEPAVRASGVDLVAAGLTTVYRAKDAAGAKILADEYWSQYPALLGESTDYQSQSGVEGVRCLQQSAGPVRCVFTNDRYVVEGQSSSENPVAEMDAVVSAQNAMLTGF